MVIDLVRSVGSANVCFRINERTCVANFARAIETRFRTPNFSDSVGSAAKIQTLTPNATKCPISFPNVAIRIASCLKHSIGSKTPIQNRL